VLLNDCTPAKLRDCKTSNGVRYPSNLVLAEIRLPLPYRAWVFADPSRQPAAIRDLAIIADKTMPYSKLEEITKNAAGDFLESVQPFDVFESKRIGIGNCSTAITMT
jgi:phenylalanyl-tRNA synthetase beta chain